jgi:transcriptional regulatory protein GAL4
LKTQSEFHIQTNHISNRLLAEPGLSAEATLLINTSMESWTHTIPLYFQPTYESPCQYRWYIFAKARIWWRFWNLKIIVFRHILLRRAISERGQISDQATQSQQEECKRICIQAAHSTIISICQYSSQGSTRLEGKLFSVFELHVRHTLILFTSGWYAT